MRVLHTSDWHLGRSFHGADLLGAQADVLDGLVEVVRDERVGLVVVAGDLYDRALPPVGAVELWGDTLERLCDAGAHVVVISGNHDSARRLGSGARVHERAGVHVRTDVRRAGEPVLLPLEGGGELAVYAIPYLEPDAVRDVLAVDGADAGELRTHTGVLKAALARAAADLAGRPGTRSIAVAHAYVAGGESSDSERELSVGGAAQVPVGLFGHVDYAALGHLHGRQVLGEGAVRYAGSPLAYSFSEDRHTKGAWLLDVGSDGVRTVEAVPTRVPRGLARLRGRLDDLLTSGAYADAERCWVAVTLTDPACPAGAMPRLQQRFPHAVTLEWAPEGGLVAQEASYAARVARRDDLEVAVEFVRHVRNADPTGDEQALLRDVVGAVVAESVDA